MRKATRGRGCVQPDIAEFIPCVPMSLSDDLLVEAANTAIAENAANEPMYEMLQISTGRPLTPDYLAMLTSKYFGVGGVKLSVGFLEQTPADLRDRILSHMNAWDTQAGANVQFAWSQSAQSADVRITRSGQGYWSYLGTDIRHIAAGQPTMCLQGFTMGTPESEYKRVVRHETGHTLGCPHEQQLPEIVALLDVQKTITWGRQALGWSEATVRSQILTPIDTRTIVMTPHADVRGIMCYQLPASITKNGQPIPGGNDIDEIDAEFIRRLYPKAVAPPPPDRLEVNIPRAGKWVWQGA